MSLEVALALLTGLLVASATCSGSETALFNLTPEEVHEEERRGDRLGRTVAHLLADHESLLLAILISNNAINIAYFALASLVATSVSEHHALWVTLGALVALILFGEILPKVVASERSLPLARLVAPLWWIMGLVLAPVSSLMQRLTGRLGGSGSDPFPTISADELKLVFEQSRDLGVVSTHVHDRLVEVIDLSRTPAHRVMTHRLDCPTIQRQTEHAEAVAAMREKPGSHILVLDEEENCIGLLTAHDLLKDGRPAKRMRKPCYLPAGANLAQALELLQAKGSSAAVVIDEYGTTLGILSLTHLAHELLGDGDSEDLPDRVPVEQLDENRWRIGGSASIEPWKPLLADPEATSQVTTIAGFLSKVTGTVPQEGDRLLHNNLLFQVERCEGRRIASVLVEKLPEIEARRMTRQGRV